MRTQVAVQPRHTYVVIVYRVDFAIGRDIPPSYDPRESRWCAYVYDEDVPEAWPGRLISQRGETQSSAAAMTEAVGYVDMLFAAWSGL